MSIVSKRDIAIQAYTLNSKNLKQHTYEKIGNYRRFLLITELQRNPIINLKDLSSKLRINYSTAKTILQTFRREKRFATKEKIIINSKREEKLCRKNLKKLGKQKVELLTERILGEFHNSKTNNLLGVYFKSEEMLGIASHLATHSKNDFNSHPKNYMNFNIDNKKSKNYNEQTIIKEGIINSNSDIGHTSSTFGILKPANETRESYLIPQNFINSNNSISVSTTTNDLMFYSPIGDIFYLVDEEEGYQEFNNQIDFHNLVYLRKKTEGKIENKLNKEFIVLPFPEFDKKPLTNLQVHFNFTPYKDTILMDYFRRNAKVNESGSLNYNFTPNLNLNMKRQFTFSPIPEENYLKGLIREKIKLESPFVNI